MQICLPVVGRKSKVYCFCDGLLWQDGDADPSRGQQATDTTKHRVPAGNPETPEGVLWSQRRLSVCRLSWIWVWESGLYNQDIRKRIWNNGVSTIAAADVQRFHHGTPDTHFTLQEELFHWAVGADQINITGRICTLTAAALPTMMRSVKGTIFPCWQPAVS